MKSRIPILALAILSAFLEVDVHAQAIMTTEV